MIVQFLEYLLLKSYLLSQSYAPAIGSLPDTLGFTFILTSLPYLQISSKNTCRKRRRELEEHPLTAQCPLIVAVSSSPPKEGFDAGNERRRTHGSMNRYFIGEGQIQRLVPLHSNYHHIYPHLFSSLDLVHSHGY
jgi:hypothetical protein